MKFFVSNIYTVAQYDFKRLDEEKAFNSYEKAFEFLKKEFFEDEYNESYLKSYFAEIVEYNLVGNEVKISRERFNCFGELFNFSKNTDVQKTKSIKINKSFVPKYKIGDIVIIKYLKGISYSLFEDTVGVITGIPQGYKEWKEQYNLPDDSWEPVYLVEFIDDTGFLSHCHPFEQEIELHIKELSSELMILDKISKHYKKEKMINEKVLKSLRFREIYALNNKTIKDINWE